MSISTNAFSITSTPQSVIASDTSARTALFTVDFGQIFIGQTNSVSPTTGHAITANIAPVVLPVPANTTIWAVASAQAILPITLRVTVSDEVVNSLGIRATPVSGAVNVTGSVAIGNFPATQPVSGPLTDAQLRAVPVPIQTAKTSLTPSAPANVTVGTTSIQLVAANANRKGLRLCVIGANTVSLSFGGVAAVATKGIILAAGSTTFEMGEFTFTTSEVRAIASAASTIVAVQEFV